MFVSLTHGSRSPRLRTRVGHTGAHGVMNSGIHQKFSSQAGVRVNSIDSCSMTPLAYAMLYRCVESVHILLKAGASCHYHPRGSTYLLKAIASGCVQTTKALLHAKADPSGIDKRGMFPLAQAIRQVFLGRPSLVDLLLSHGADPDQTFRYIWNSQERGFTSLHLATMQGYGDIVNALLSHGANPNKRIDKDNTQWGGFTPLHMAIYKGHDRIVGLLLSHDVGSLSPRFLFLPMK